jgi:hypothetical protein
MEGGGEKEGGGLGERRGEGGVREEMRGDEKDEKVREGKGRWTEKEGG